MSLESALFSQMGQQAVNLERNQLIRDQMRQIVLLRDFTAQPFVFLNSRNVGLSSNVADAVIIAAGQRVPPGHRATVRDFNLNYTTAAGTVRIVILSPTNEIRQDILRDITSTTNGVGETVLEEGEKLGVVGQTAGAGTFNVFCSGSKQRFREVDF